LKKKKKGKELYKVPLLIAFFYDSFVLFFCG